MLDDKTYREWTSVFSPDSHFEGNWEKGTEMRFVGPGENGKDEGIVSHVAENKPYEFISLEHKAVIVGGEEDKSDKYKAWIGAHENYTFKEVDGVTEVRVDTDTDEESKKIFQDMWPKSLEKLKELAEKA